MRDNHQLYEWIARPETLDRDSLHELRALIARYPYFQTARLLYLRALVAQRHPDLPDALRQAAVYVADRTLLFRLIEAEKLKLMQEKTALAGTSPAAPAPEGTSTPEGTPATDRTLTLIDTYLEAMGAPSDVATRPQPEMPVDMATYLIQHLPDAAPVTPMTGQHLIDKFLQEAPDGPAEESRFATESPAEETPDEESDPEEDLQDEENGEEAKNGENESEEDYFTETLAKIYIKQHRYSKALEIIKKLNLKYPKKNVYFADQIRFLEKLIINNHSK